MKNLPICETFSQFGASVFPKAGLHRHNHLIERQKITFPAVGKNICKSSPPWWRRTWKSKHTWQDIIKILWMNPAHWKHRHPCNQSTSLIWCRSSSQQRNLSTPTPNLEINRSNYIFQGYWVKMKKTINWVKMKKTINVVKNDETDPPCSQVPNFLWSVYQ